MEELLLYSNYEVIKNDYLFFLQNYNKIDILSFLSYQKVSDGKEKVNKNYNYS